MNCKNCGFPLNGNQTCPNCGIVNELATEEQTQQTSETPVTPAPVVEQAATSIEQAVPVVEPTTPVIEQPVITETQSAPVTPVVEKKKKNLLLIIILIVLAVLLIGVGVFLAIKFLFPKGENGGNSIINIGTTSKCGKVNLDYYRIEELSGGKVMWELTDLGKKQENLTIPAGIDHFLGKDFADEAVVKNVCFESDDDIDLKSAFNNSPTLETITLPANLTYDFSMNNCPKLKEITIPAGIDNIRGSAFSGDTSLKTVTFKGNNVKVIGVGAFKDCTSLESINLPDSVETIYSNAFENCTSLKSITLPKSLTYMTNSSFLNSGIKTMIVPEEVELASWSKGEYRLNIEGCKVKVYKDSWADIHFDEVFGSGMKKEYISIK